MTNTFTNEQIKTMATDIAHHVVCAYLNRDADSHGFKRGFGQTGTQRLAVDAAFKVLSAQLGVTLLPTEGKVDDAMVMAEVTEAPMLMG